MSGWQKQMADFDSLEKDLQTMADKIGGKETKNFLKNRARNFRKRHKPWQEDL